MERYAIKSVNAKNKGDAREWALCNYYGAERAKHDSKAYNVASDLEIGGKKISIKASHATLMNGTMCHGLQTFDEIWELYKANTHSNTFAYITVDFVVYEMNINEFESFIYAFGYVEKDSEKNGGYMKIRLRAESKKMLAYLDQRAS